MIIYTDPYLLKHHTGQHPENANRLLPSMEWVQSLNRIEGQTVDRPNWEPVSVERLESIHPASHIERVRQFASDGGGYLDPDTVVSPDSFDVACQATGAVCDAVGRVMSDSDRLAFCLIRPPGHHATVDTAMGFCLFNHIAIGAQLARQVLGIERVMIIDWDVHHGNGTQDIFYADGNVSFLSMHRQYFYPFSGAAEETGTESGIGATCNIPVAFGTSRGEILRRFRDQLTQFAERHQPELILLSAGFDAHREDPIGSLGLHTEDFAELTKTVMETANRYAQGRLVSVLEGGYNPPAVAASIEVHLKSLIANQRS